MPESNLVKLITLDPAHFHAALVQKQMLPGISKRVAVFAPLGPDVLAHLKLIEGFNTRPDNPTSWELDIHCSPRSLEEMVAAHPGNVVVLAGRDRAKIGKINASLEAGINVLADKPWIIRTEDFAKLESAFALAGRKRLVAYDIMTERHEITNLLQRELVNDPAVFGSIIPPDPANPGVYMESIHQIFKLVAGAPNPRPLFFFDISDQGEGLSDVGTHLVDLTQWTLFPDKALNYRTDVHVQGGKRWPTAISLEQFKRVTGASAFPRELATDVHGDQFNYNCNNQVDYTLRGVQVQLRALWQWDSPAGVDLQHAIYRGTKATVEVRQTASEKYQPEVFVQPNGSGDHSDLTTAVRARLDRLQATYPGVGSEITGDEIHITIPDRFRVGHEAHFGQVLADFLKYLKNPDAMPAWEEPNMLVKYCITTTGVQKCEHES